jgi:hypothetical protein
MRSSEDDGGVRAEFTALCAHGPACHNTLPDLGNRVAPLVNLRSIATPQLDNGVDAVTRRIWEVDSGYGLFHTLPISLKSVANERQAQLPPPETVRRGTMAPCAAQSQQT